MLVICSLLFPVFSWRDNRLHTLGLCFLNDGIAVITLVGNQVLCRDSGNELLSFGAIRAGSFYSKDSEGVRIFV